MGSFEPEPLLYPWKFVATAISCEMTKRRDIKSNSPRGLSLFGASHIDIGQRKPSVVSNADIPLASEQCLLSLAYADPHNEYTEKDRTDVGVLIFGEQRR